MKITCKKCGIEKSHEDFYAHPAGKYGRDSKCKECVKQYARDRRKDPAIAAKLSAYDREKRQRPEYKSSRNAVRRMRRRRDPNMMVRDFCCRSVYRFLKMKGNSVSTYIVLGYTPDKLRQRIEYQFQPGMSWDNRSDWHIDHIKPVKAFLDQGITDPSIINALCNLRPVWARENLVKNCQWPIAKPANDNDLFGVAV